MSLLSKTRRGEPVAPTLTMEEMMAQAAMRPTEINVINNAQAILIEDGIQSVIAISDIENIVGEYQAAGKRIIVNDLPTDSQIEAMQR